MSITPQEALLNQTTSLSSLVTVSNREENSMERRYSPSVLTLSLLIDGLELASVYLEILNGFLLLALLQSPLESTLTLALTGPCGRGFHTTSAKNHLPLVALTFLPPPAARKKAAALS